MDPVYNIVLTWPKFFLKFMILRLCLLSFHLDVDKIINTYFRAQIELRYLQQYPRLDSQFVNYFSQNLTVFIGYSFKLNEGGSFSLG